MNDKPLVLVTRVGPSGRHLADSVESLGLPAFHAELYRLEALDNMDKVSVAVSRALPADLLVLTSQEGVRQARALAIGDQLIRLPTVVPGPGTASVAREAGFSCVFAPENDGNSEAMLALEALTEVSDKRVLILAACHGRRLVDQVLRQRGARVQRIDVYRRTPLPDQTGLVNQIQTARQLVTLIASDGALQLLHEHLDAALWSKLVDGKVVVPSERIADNARRLGCDNVVVADGADNHAMLDALGVLTTSCS